MVMPSDGIIGSFLVGYLYFMIFWASALGAVVTIIYLYLTKQDRKHQFRLGRSWQSQL